MQSRHRSSLIKVMMLMACMGSWRVVSRVLLVDRNYLASEIYVDEIPVHTTDPWI